MEVLIAVAIAGLAVTGGYRLAAVSIRLLGDVRSEREIVNAGEYIWLRFRTDDDMPESGHDDDLFSSSGGITWETSRISLPVGDYELKFRCVKVSTASGKSVNIYIAE